MQLIEKLTILANSAKYDVSCSSSGSNRSNKKGQVGNAALPEFATVGRMTGAAYRLWPIE